VLAIRQECELIEQSRIARDLDAFDGREPRQRLIERAGIFQLLLRGEGEWIGMTARIRGPRQIAVDVRQARLAIALAREGGLGLVASSLIAPDFRRTARRVEGC